jgi:uncharacterized OsmC-like protein
MADIKFRANAYNENPTKTIVEIGKHRIVVDEPKNLGGTDEGPTPVDFLLAGLAGCINVVGHIVAKELGFKLNGISVELEGDLNPARFLGKSKEQRAGYKDIRVKIKPDTDIDKATLEKWLEIIEDRCPVSDTFVNPTPVEMTLAF